MSVVAVAVIAGTAHGRWVSAAYSFSFGARISLGVCRAIIARGCSVCARALLGIPRGVVDAEVQDVFLILIFIRFGVGIGFGFGVR